MILDLREKEIINRAILFYTFLFLQKHVPKIRASFSSKSTWRLDITIRAVSKAFLVM